MVSLTLLATLPKLRPTPCQTGQVCQEANTGHLAILLMSLLLTRQDADKKGLPTILEDVKNLAKKARENSFKQLIMRGYIHCFKSRSVWGLAVLCHHKSTPGWHSSNEKKVIPGSAAGEFKFASYMSVTLSCDQHVIDAITGPNKDTRKIKIRRARIFVLGGLLSLVLFLCFMLFG